MKKFLINVNGKSYDVEVVEVASDGAVSVAPVVAAPQAPKAQAPQAAPSANVNGTKVEAPMPGTILKVNVNVGDSVNEGDTVAVLEAMKMGFPCISTTCAGADEYITSYENGILVPVGDEKAMQDALLYMMEHEEETKKMGERAKETSNLFCAENVLFKWHEVLD